MLKNSLKISGIVAILYIKVLIGLFGAYVVSYAVGVFRIPYLIDLTVIQLYGLWIIVELVRYKYKSTDEEYSEVLLREVEKCFSQAVNILLTWALVWVISTIIS